MRKIAATILALLAGAAVLFAAPKGQKGPRAESTAPGASRATDHRIEQILKSMALEEKAMLLVGAWEEGANPNIISSAGRTHALSRFGLGQTTMNDGATGLRMDTLRTGFPNERYYCTGFPVSTLMASTWNGELVQRVGAAIASEMSHYGTDLLLAPSLNIHRNPLCGRNFEYYSEDPVLAGRTGAMMVRGVQQLGGGATVKHFAANSQQTARVHNDVRASQRALRELKAYAKTPLLAAGESATVNLTVPLEYLGSFHDDSLTWITDAGTYTVSLGSSVEDIKATLQFKLSKPTISAPCTKL